jgi:hypothetical protein
MEPVGTKDAEFCIDFKNINLPNDKMHSKKSYQQKNSPETDFLPFYRKFFEKNHRYTMKNNIESCVIHSLTKFHSSFGYIALCN